MTLYHDKNIILNPLFFVKKFYRIKAILSKDIGISNHYMDNTVFVL